MEFNASNGVFPPIRLYGVKGKQGCKLVSHENTNCENNVIGSILDLSARKEHNQRDFGNQLQHPFQVHNISHTADSFLVFHHISLFVCGSFIDCAETRAMKAVAIQNNSHARPTTANSEP